MKGVQIWKVPETNTYRYVSLSLKRLAPSSIRNYSILFLIIMEDEWPKVFKLVKTNSALDFVKK